MGAEEAKCPKCGSGDRQQKKGFTGGGSQRFFCGACKHKYTPRPKKWAYSAAERALALRLLVLGNSGRAVGKVLGMCRSNAYRWAIEEAEKKNGVWTSAETDRGAFELDELHWHVGGRKGHENGANAYVMTMTSGFPRQIVGFAVESSVNARAAQGIVDVAVAAANYFTDGATAYLDVDFPGQHRRNVRDKSDTHEVESVNADLRHYISGLARRSRCFFRKLSTLRAVLRIFVDAYNTRDFGFNHSQFV